MAEPMQADCHAHVIDPARFPYVPGPGYMPKSHETGDAQAYLATLTANGFTHGLIVQPSCYAFDNGALVDAIAAGAGRLKGIAVVPPDVGDPELHNLSRRGVVGARVNLGNFDPGFFERPESERFLARMAAHGWFVQVYGDGAAWRRIVGKLARCGARVIVDHFGHPDTRLGLDQDGFGDVLALGRGGTAVVKLSSVFRVSRQPFPHRDVDSFVAAVLDAFGPDRVVWGSDWPFLNTPHTVRYAQQLSCLARWVPDERARRRILSDNPAALFGFAAAAERPAPERAAR